MQHILGWLEKDIKNAQKVHDDMIATKGTSLIQSIELGLKTDDYMK